LRLGITGPTQETDMTHGLPFEPVERDCICLERRDDDEPHIAACELRFRSKFFAAWRGIRDEFYRS
jgi:hypothetical protein